MSWVQANGKAYYYRAWKRHGKVVRQYLGSGPEAHEAALEDVRRRQERERKREVLRATRQHWKDKDQVVQDVADRIRILFHAAMTATGFYQHDRGEWRRRNDVQHDPIPG